MYFKIEQRICGGKRPAAAEDTFNQWFLYPAGCIARNRPISRVFSAEEAERRYSGKFPEFCAENPKEKSCAGEKFVL